MELNWRKSSYSDGGTDTDCVEVASLPVATAVRDSKNPSATLTFPAEPWRTFLTDLA